MAKTNSVPSLNKMLGAVVTLSAAAAPALAANVPQEASMGRYFLIWIGVMVLLVIGQNALGKPAKKEKKPKAAAEAKADAKEGEAKKAESAPAPGAPPAPAPAPAAPSESSGGPSGGGGW